MFRKITTGLLAALALSACQPGALGGINSPAPLEQTVVDDQALETAWRSFDAFLDAINLLGDAGVIVPGSDTGKAVAAGIRKVNSALKAAESFVAAGSSSDYVTAMLEAKEGINEIRVAMRSN